MNTFQILMLIAGVLVVASGFIDFKALFSKIITSFNNKPTDAIVTKATMNVPMPDVSPSIDVHPYIPSMKKLKINDIVFKWEELREICVNNKLASSTAKLDDMFGTFLDLVKEEAKNDK